jgi:hypothetical protein
MIWTPKWSGTSCGCLLGFGLSLNGNHTIKGEVVNVEGPNFFVKGKDGKEVHLHTDSTTQMMTGIIGKGDRVEAQVNEENHALSIRSAQ